MFNGIWLVATEPLTIQGRDVQTGERFHLSRVHSGALLVTGRATILRPQPPPKASTPEPPAPTPRRRRRTTKADTPQSTETSQTLTGPAAEPSCPIDDEPLVIPPRRYHRRDLEADE